MESPISQASLSSNASDDLPAMIGKGFTIESESLDELLLKKEKLRHDNLESQNQSLLQELQINKLQREMEIEKRKYFEQTLKLSVENEKEKNKIQIELLQTRLAFEKEKFEKEDLKAKLSYMEGYVSNLVKNLKSTHGRDLKAIIRQLPN